MLNVHEGQPLSLVSVDSTLIDRIKTDKADLVFIDALVQVTRALAREVEVNENTCLLRVPRGGNIPTLALLMEEKYKNVQVAIANIGSSKIEKEPLLPDDLPLVDHYVIPDGIMATGETMKKVVEAILEKHAEAGKTGKPRFTIMCPMVSSIGLEADNNFMVWAKDRGIEVEVVTAHVENEGGYVQFDGKSALIVGQVYNDKNEFAPKIGDYGDMSEEAWNNGTMADYLTLVSLGKMLQWQSTN